jgi:hypothetical protein
MLKQTKQIPSNNGYYVPVGDCRTRFYAQSGTDTAPNFATNMISSMSTSGAYVSSLVATNGAGGVFRDHGKTVLSSGRVFRKVQLMVSTVGTEGVGGSYLTGYIELPGTGGMSSGAGGLGVFTPVARLG